MLDIDITCIVQIVNFLFLLVVMNAILYRPLRKIMAERREKVSGIERDIEGLTKNANQKLEDFKAKLQDAHVRGNKDKETLKSQAAAEEKQVTTKAREDADAYKAQMSAQVAQDVKATREQLKAQVSSFASEIAGKILGRAVQ